MIRFSKKFHLGNGVRDVRQIGVFSYWYRVMWNINVVLKIIRIQICYSLAYNTNMEIIFPPKFYLISRRKKQDSRTDSTKYFIENVTVEIVSGIFKIFHNFHSEQRLLTEV